MDLFDQRRERILAQRGPLADRMRPRTLDEFVGQDHIIGPGRLLRRAIQIDQLSSVIFFGPPGTGKTTLARIIANTTKAQFLSINAVLAGVADIRKAIDSAKETLSLHGRRTILFIDEVHRFNKAQQDALLPHVENGVVILIGATTENPYFEVNKALVSRSRIFPLKPLTDDDLRQIAVQALADPERGYGGKNVRVDDDALAHLVRTANGDARGVLNALELAVETTAAGDDGTVHVTAAVAEESIQKKAVLYDKDGDAHYDTISAFIKSVRGSDPDAALYWMARMVYAGEDPRFVLRRMMILACEDVGMADPNALRVVVDAARAFDYVGLPEGRYHLAHACLYLATAPKSNSSMAFFDALDAVEKELASDDVPGHLRDASRDAEGLGHGKGYLYPHAYRDHWVAQQYLPELLQGRLFYQPSDQGFEDSIRERVGRLREAMVEAMVEDQPTSPFDCPPSAGGSGWLRRTSSEAFLASVRDRLLELAAVGRDSVVLDLNGRTGLLAFEASRRVREGGVWVLAHDEKSKAALDAMAEPFGALSRPHTVLTSWETFERDLAQAAGADVRFTAIVGRNILTAVRNKAALAERMLALLDGKGKLVLAETVASQGQRLSDLAPLTGADASLAEALADAERDLFGDPDNPMVNWSAETLREEISRLPGLHVEVECVDSTGPRRITRDEVASWFRVSGADERPSLGDRVRHRLSDARARDLHESIRASLANREVSWKTVVAFFVVTRSAQL